MAFPTTDVALEKMNLSSDLALEFFVTFARFEYALIASGAEFRKVKDGAVMANWDAFARTLAKESDAGLKPVLDAGRTLLDEPPKRLELDGGDPRFVEVKRNGQSDIRWLVRGVTAARNNLFHGGKFYTPAESPKRNPLVVGAALNVLREILKLDVAKVVRLAYGA